jgi:streptogramin lyase
MKSALYTVLCSAVLIACLVVGTKAADTSIHGVVTDTSGKPVRGAMVKAAAKGKNVVRFSQADGSYEISVPAGTYDLSIDAFGYGGKTQSVSSSDSAAVNFTLTPRIDVGRLSGAEVEELIPSDDAGRLIKGTCIDCHALDYVMHRRGMTEDEWASFLPQMTRGRRTQPIYGVKKLAALSAALAKYFGPDSKYFGPDADPPTAQEIKHPMVADPVLKATIREFTPPAGSESFVHSVALTDGAYGRPASFVNDSSAQPMVWFTQAGLKWGAAGSSKVASFDPVTETFKEVETNVHQDHTGVIDKQGRYWVAAANSGLDVAKLAMIDTKTGAVKTFKFPGKKESAHTAVLDQAGNVWMSINAPPEGGAAEVWFFDTEKEQFKAYNIPMPARYPAGSYADWRGGNTMDENEEGQKPEAARYSTYHVSIDSKGMVWASSLTAGTITRINPASGEVKTYSPPNVPGIRGVMVDHNDNVWFSDYFAHHLGKLDPKTEKFTMYQPPTKGVTPYGIVEEKRTGYIWYADQTGANITRFDPKNEQFVEYPIPHPGYPRFLDVDQKGRVWFGEYFSGKIGVLDPAGNSQSVASR